jgi:hypothetical protein
MTLPPIIDPLPFNLTNGTVADAVKVMADFQAIVVNVNENAANGAMFPGGVLSPQYGGTGSSVSSYDQNAILVGGSDGSLTSSPVLIDASTGGINGFRGVQNAQTGTTYTIQSTDTGKWVTHDNGGAVTVTLPKTAPIGFVCEGMQIGAGQVTYSAQSGATLINRQSQFKIAGQGGVVSLRVISNSDGNSAVWVLAGDTA